MRGKAASVSAAPRRDRRCPVNPRDQQPDFSQGRRGRPVHTHDEAAGGGNRNLVRARKREGGQSARFGIVSTCNEAAAEKFNGLPMQGAVRQAISSARAADAGYRDCSCRGAEREAQSHACKFTLASLPRELMPNPSLKRSANGRPPGPVWRYAVHFRQPGPGVLPSSPA